MTLQTKLTKRFLQYFSFVGSFAVEFTWDEKVNDFYLEKVTGLPIVAWYFREFCAFILPPLLCLSLHQKWDTYIESKKASELMVNVFFLFVLVFICTLQQLFHKHSEEMIALINQTVKVGKHFEKRKNY